MIPPWSCVQFSPLELKDKPLFDSAFRDYPPEISELTFTNLFSWRQVYGFKFCYWNGLIIIRADNAKAPFYLPPVGPGSLREAVKQISGENKLAFHRVPESLARIFGDDPDFTVVEDRDNFDYLYLCAELVSLAGRPFDAKRSQVRKFKSENKYIFQELQALDLAGILEFAQAWCGIKFCDRDKGLQNEQLALREMIGHFTQLKLVCAAISLGGKIAALAIAERLNPETLVMHMLKADPQVPGLYQVMLNDFLRHFAGDFKYVNLEQDLGVAGLRAFKESYHPFKLIKKYSLCLK